MFIGCENLKKEALITKDSELVKLLISERKIPTSFDIHS